MSVFKLRSITPIGFKIPDYPVTICSICRGLLLSVCDVCADSKNEICEVINSTPGNNSTNEQISNIYHKHCFELIKKTEQSNVEKK